MNMIPDNHLDRLGVVFDDDSLVSDAGLLVAGTLMSRRTFRHVGRCFLRVIFSHLGGQIQFFGDGGRVGIV